MMELQIGGKYTVTEICTGSGKKKYRNFSFTGILLQEYERFYLFDCGNYRTTLTKAMLWCGDYAVKAVS